MNQLNNLTLNKDNMAVLNTTGNIYQLSETGKLIIEKLQQGKSKEEIIKELADKYEKSWEEVYSDVEDFYLKLKIIGLYHE